MREHHVLTRGLAAGSAIGILLTAVLIGGHIVRTFLADQFLIYLYMVPPIATSAYLTLKAAIHLAQENEAAEARNTGIDAADPETEAAAPAEVAYAAFLIGSLAIAIPAWANLLTGNFLIGQLLGTAAPGTISSLDVIVQGLLLPILQGTLILEAAQPASNLLEQ